MKLYKISLALLLGLSTFTSCNDKLELLNPNQQTTGTFGFNADDLQESVIAAYNHIRMEGSYARVGYTIDVCRGDEAWNSSQVWYLPFDDLNAEVTSDITWWPWREWYYTINVCNFTISRCGEDNSQLTEKMKRIKGQALFLRVEAVLPEPTLCPVGRDFQVEPASVSKTNTRLVLGAGRSFAGDFSQHGGAKLQGWGQICPVPPVCTPKRAALQWRFMTALDGLNWPKWLILLGF